MWPWVRPHPGLPHRRLGRRPARYSEAVLYTLLSETSGDGRVAFTDNATGVSLNVGLRGGRAALVLVNRATRRVIADYPRGCTDPGFGTRDSRLGTRNSVRA